MNFTFSFNIKARFEYDESIFWYAERSLLAAQNFINEVDYTVDLICRNPFIWKNPYKNFRELGLKNFPFIIIYFIDIEKNKVIISSVFHTSRNPKKKYL